jgi:diaminopropionate ammonia-lyase
MSVEPASADCLLESVAAGRIVSVPGPHDSIMSGLNCGRPSLVAWPVVSGSIDLLVSVDDESAREAMRLAAETGVVSGETGAAGLGGLLELLRAEDAGRRRADPRPALQLRRRYRPGGLPEGNGGVAREPFSLSASGMLDNTVG